MQFCFLIGCYFLTGSGTGGSLSSLGSGIIPKSTSILKEEIVIIFTYPAGITWATQPSNREGHRRDEADESRQAVHLT